MSPAHVTDEADIQFLIASPKVVSAAEAARVRTPAHGSSTRLLQRLEPDPETLGPKSGPLIRPALGVPVVDNSTLHKPRAKHIDLVAHHWSGNRHAVVRGTA
jgi:putative transposase